MITPFTPVWVTEGNHVFKKKSARERVDAGYGWTVIGDYGCWWEVDGSENNIKRKASDEVRTVVQEGDAGGLNRGAHRGSGEKWGDVSHVCQAKPRGLSEGLDAQSFSIDSTLPLLLSTCVHLWMGGECWREKVQVLVGMLKNMSEDP